MLLARKSKRDSSTACPGAARKGKTRDTRLGMTPRSAVRLRRQAAALHTIEVDVLRGGERKDAGLKPLALHRQNSTGDLTLFFADEVAAAAWSHAGGVGGSCGNVATLAHSISVRLAVHG